MSPEVLRAYRCLLIYFPWFRMAQIKIMGLERYEAERLKQVAHIEHQVVYAEARRTKEYTRAEKIAIQRSLGYMLEDDEQ